MDLGSPIRPDVNHRESASHGKADGPSPRSGRREDSPGRSEAQPGGNSSIKGPEPVKRATDVDPEQPSHGSQNLVRA